MTGQQLLDRLAAETPQERERRRTLTIGDEGRDVYELRLMLRAMQRGPKLWDTAPAEQGNMSVYTGQLDEVVRKLQADAAGACGPVDGACGPTTWAWLARFGRAETKKTAPELSSESANLSNVSYYRELAAAMVAEARACVGIREVGKNRGPEVEQIIREAGGRPGDAWCAWFCKAMRRRACRRLRIAEPHFDISGNVDVLVRQAKAAGRWLNPVLSDRRPEPGDLLVIGKNGDYSHVGIIERISGQTVYTIEGNTDGAGSGEGDGCYAKKRRMKPGYAVVRVL